LVEVKQVELILGHQQSAATGVQSKWKDSNEISLAIHRQTSPAPNVSLGVKRGDRLVAFLTPAMHPPNKPEGYIATRLDHAKDALVESVSSAVAGTLHQVLGPYGDDKAP
jgi:hypothetical protein